MKRSSGGGGLSTGIVTIIFLLVFGYIVVFFFVFKGGATGCDIDADNEKSLQLTTQLKSKDTEMESLKYELSQMKEAAAKVTPPPKLILPDTSVRPGLVVLGMHRSGTSVVGGLINKMGLKTGGPLIGAAADNAKGFFERIDVVLQNDYIMRNQQINYAASTWRYDARRGLKDVLNDDGKFFNEGSRGLKFLNDPANYPWMLKDPRLCITIRTWLPLFNFVPAVLFTYRHPMDVAMSFFHRYEHFKIPRSLKMWYVYNRLAIQQSHDLCRVTTSHSLIMSQPQIEMDRVYEELKACGVSPPHKLTAKEIEEFVDPKLQHGKNALDENPCTKDLKTLKPPTTWVTDDPDHIKLYQEVLRVFCAMEDRSAYSPDFQWDMTIRD